MCVCRLNLLYLSRLQNPISARKFTRLPRKRHDSYSKASIYSLSLLPHRHPPQQFLQRQLERPTFLLFSLLINASDAMFIFPFASSGRI